MLFGRNPARYNGKRPLMIARRKTQAAAWRGPRFLPAAGRVHTELAGERTGPGGHGPCETGRECPVLVMCDADSGARRPVGKARRARMLGTCKR